ncbi:HTH CENPB-type domain-containing protein [Trichonephila clavipes]|nr:HTH CENPB-type domain-containing protein [Trichonephila clavipes]
MRLGKSPERITCNQKQCTFIRLKRPKKNANESKNFKATFSWFSRFMAHNNLVLREKTKVAQMLLKDMDYKLKSFQKYVIGLRKQKKYSLSHIGNMDETPLTLDMIGNKTIDNKGTQKRFT